MSPNVTEVLLVLSLLAWPQGAATPPCADGTAAVLAAAETVALAGEFGPAAEMLRSRMAVDGRCGELIVASRAWYGWLTAAAAAARGGTDEALAGVRAMLETFGPPGPGVSDAAYASAVLRAAAAAAQHERDEMQVWLEHARDLAARRARVQAAARWPLPIDLVEGELWSGLDDYELAEASFTRALAEHDSAAAWRGLARAQDRRGNRRGACAGFRRALDLASPSFPDGAVASEARRYLRECEP